MNQRKQWQLSVGLLAAIILVSVIGFYSTAEADSSTVPGSADDPVVTKGYVDAKVEALVQAELEKIGSNTGGSGGLTPGAMAPIEVISVPSGKSIIVNAGGELIVRTGRAVAVSPDANGLSDMTDGVDIPPGKPVGNNHLILFPRDGRGVKPDPKKKAQIIVLVRGGYELK